MTQTNLHEVQSPNETNHTKEQAPFMTPVTLKKEDDTAKQQKFKKEANEEDLGSGAASRRRRTATGEVQSDMQYERDTLLDRERNWLSKNLLPMTRI